VLSANGSAKVHSKRTLPVRTYSYIECQTSPIQCYYVFWQTLYRLNHFQIVVNFDIRIALSAHTVSYRIYPRINWEWDSIHFAHKRGNSKDFRFFWETCPQSYSTSTYHKYQCRLSRNFTTNKQRIDEGVGARGNKLPIGDYMKNK